MSDYAVAGKIREANVVLIVLTQSKALMRKWTSRLAQQNGHIRISRRLASDGTALIDTTVSKGTESRIFSTEARWRLLDNKTLHLWGARPLARLSFC